MASATARVAGTITSVSYAWNTAVVFTGYTAAGAFTPGHPEMNRKHWSPIRMYTCMVFASCVPVCVAWKVLNNTAHGI